MNDFDTSGVDLWMALRKASGALEIHAVKSIAHLEMCPSDFAVLTALLQRGPTPVNTLGKDLLLTSGSITVGIDRLAKRKLVERQWQSKDKRVCLVALTPDGEKLIRATFQNHASEMDHAFSGLSRPERKNLLALLEKLSVTTQALLTGKPQEKTVLKTGKEKKSEPKAAAAPESTASPDDIGFAGFTGVD